MYVCGEQSVNFNTNLQERKMKIIAILGGLLVIAPAYAQEKCQKEANKTEFYIYKTNVWIPAFLPAAPNFNCKQFANWQTIREYASDFINKYGVRIEGLKCNSVQEKCTFCTYPLYAYILENKVSTDTSSATFLQYDTGYATYGYNGPQVYWNSNPCNALKLIYKGKFDVWTDLHNQHKYIHNEFHTLQLGNKSTLCSTMIWKTNYKGIVVTTSNIGTAEKIISTYKFNSTIYKNCDIPNTSETTRNEATNNPPQKWFVYEYPVAVIVHFCSAQASDAPGAVKLNKNVSYDNSNLLKQCIDKFNFSSSSTFTKTLTVDLETDTINSLPSDCRYSKGICEASKAFWSNSYKCSDIVKVFEGYEEKCDNSKCISSGYNTTRLMLQAPGQLCGANITHTSQPGLVVSEMAIVFSSHNDFDQILMAYNDQVNHVQTVQYYLILVVVICVLYYLFNVIVNFITLKRLSKGKCCLLNSVSLGLTRHYLYFSQETCKLGDQAGAASSHYEVVENELYNKPKHKPSKNNIV